MRKLLFLPIVITLLSFSESKDDSDLQPPAWRIVSTSVDPNLPKGFAEMRFQFSDSTGAPIHDSIRMAYNGKYKTLFPDASGKAMLSVPRGKYQFNLFYNTAYFEIWTDTIEMNSNAVLNMDVQFQQAREIYYTFKPVIYVYPETSQAYSIQLNVNGELGFTYPAYTNGWNFVADHDGTIYMNGKEYDYLFWDSKSPIDYNTIDVQSGSIVERDSLTGFLETNLAAMGLTPREQQDFITFWCPLMQTNEKTYIHFMFNEEYNTIASLNVTPTPNSIFRVFMVWSDATEIDAKNIHPQTIETFSRTGSTVVEWGGAEAKKLGEVL